MRMTTEAGIGGDPDAPTALLQELTGAARRLRTPPALDNAGQPTAYHDIVDRQFQEAADRFVTSDGRTVEDALAFSHAARLILASAINGAANSPTQDIDWRMLIYGARLVERLHTCLEGIAARPPTASTENLQ